MDPDRRKTFAVDSGGENPFLATQAARMRQLFCQADIPAYPSFPLAAKALAHLVAYWNE